MGNPKYVIKKDKRGEFRFTLKAGNGETILASEGYKSKQGCQSGIASVQKNAGNDTRFDRRDAKNGQFYFVLKAANAEIIGTSEMYKTRSGRDNGIKVVMRDAGAKSVVDES